MTKRITGLVGGVSAVLLAGACESEEAFGVADDVVMRELVDNGMRLNGMRLNGMRLNGDDGTADYIEIKKTNVADASKVLASHLIGSQLFIDTKKDGTFSGLGLVDTVFQLDLQGDGRGHHKKDLKITGFRPLAPGSDVAVYNLEVKDGGWQPLCEDGSAAILLADVWDPSTGDRGTIVIEGAFGLGEVVVGGQVEVDTYILNHQGPTLRQVRVGRKQFKLVRGADGRDLKVTLSPEEAARRVLSDAEAEALARIGLRIEAHYGAPQDIEWAVATGGEFAIVQTRPITTLAAPAPATDPAASAAAGSVLISGLGASPGVATGRVRVLRSPAEGEQLQTGEMLVAPMTSPDWVPTLRRAAGIITDSGGMTCHAAIVSRELRIPCVVGTRDATRVLRDGELVTIDGRRVDLRANLLLADRLRPEDLAEVDRKSVV